VRTRRILLGLLAYGLLLLGLATRDHRFIVISLPLWLYFGAALLDYPDAPQLTVTRTVEPPVVTEGDSVTVSLSLRNVGKRPALFLVADPYPPVLHLRDGVTRCLIWLAPQDTLTLTYDLGARRGHFDFPEVQATACQTWGLFSQPVSVPTHASLMVLPQIPALRAIPIRPRRTLGFSGPILARQGGAGTDMFGVREYQPGDPLRRINWRATARYHDRAFTTEFEQERITDVGLILDVRRYNAMQAHGELLLDYSVRATAALAVRLLRDGHRVGLLFYGQGMQWVISGYGRVQQLRILRMLAAVTPATDTFFDNLKFLSPRMFPARSQLIFISPLMLDDHVSLFRLRARGYSVLVVSPDVVAFEAASADYPPLAVRFARIERALLLRRLRQGGIVTVDWPTEVPLEEKLYTALAHVPVQEVGLC